MTAESTARSSHSTRNGEHVWSLGMTFVCLFVTCLFLLPSTVILPGPLVSQGSPAVALSLLAAGAVATNFMLGRTHNVSLSAGPLTLLLSGALFCCVWAVGQTRGLSAELQASATRSILATIGNIAVAIAVATAVKTSRQRLTVVVVIVATLSFSGVVGVLESLKTYDARFLFKPPGFELNRQTGTILRAGFVRVLGTSDSPIEFGVLMACLLALSIFVLRAASDRRVRLLGAVAAGLALIAVPYSVSRTGVLCLIGVAAVQVFSLRLRAMAAGVMVVAVATTSLYLLSPSRFHELVNLFARAEADSSVTSRTDDYASASASFARHPILGEGLGSTLPSATRFIDNQWLQAVVQGGIVGVIATALIFLAAFSAVAPFGARRLPGEDAAYLGVALAVLISSFTFDLFAFRQVTFLLFVVIGLAWSAKAEAGRVITSDEHVGRLARADDEALT